MPISESIIRQVTELFTLMDQAYDAAAEQSGFVCHGCRDNCCMTRFYHHTLMELVYVKSGVAALPSRQQRILHQRAHDARQRMDQLSQRNEPVRVMCPLNEGQRCMLYSQRPMICRLHGIPHQLHRPDGQTRTGPGCDAFYTQCRQAAVVLDRTPLYVEMAKLEQQIRQAVGYHGKIKMTIAEMIVDIDHEIY